MKLRKSQKLGILKRLLAIQAEDDDALTEIIHLLIKEFKASACSLNLISNIFKKKVYYLAEKYIELEDELFDIKTVPFNLVVKKLEPVIIKDYLKEENDSTIMNFLEAKSFVGFPIVSGRSGILGVLSLFSSKKSHYKSKTLDMIELFANRIGLTIEKMILEGRIKKLQEDLAKITFIDDLTGIYKRSILVSQLEEELRRAKRYQRPLSCVLMEIDNWQDVLRKYGHDVSAHLLKEASNILKSSIRGIDKIYRYKMNSFFIVFPETGMEDTFTIVERIRYYIENYEFNIEGFDDKFDGALPKAVQLNISIGLSSYPNEHVNSTYELIKLTDKFLAESKVAPQDSMN